MSQSTLASTDPARRPRFDWRAVATLIRPHQWSKNALVVVPAVTSWGLYAPAELASTALAVVAMSAAASAIYVVNDVLDVAADRAHPTKRRRPLASGAITPMTAWCVAAVLAAAAAAVGSGLPFHAQMLLGLYGIAALSYSLWLKQIAVVDLALLTSFYIIRVLLGAEALRVSYSSWFLAFVGLAFLSLGALKRAVELGAMSDGAATAENRRGYLASDGPVMLAFGVSFATVATVVLALFASSGARGMAYTHPEYLLAACPMYLLYMFRLWLGVARRTSDFDPVAQVLRDPFAYLTGVALIAVVLIAR